MMLGATIREKRRALGMTQEQTAEKLGVTASAVNKWERGAACPDIALLAPLARLLKTDLNELLSFRRELTDREIADFTGELLRAVKEEGFPAAWALAEEKLREYPECPLLALGAAVQLDGCLALFPPEEGRETYRTRLTERYEELADCQDLRVRNQARFLLVSRCIEAGEYERAEALLDQLPDETEPADRELMRASLLRRQGRAAEAAALLERKLLRTVGETQRVLFSLCSAALKLGEDALADRCAALSGETAELFGLWEYNRYVGDFHLAVARKDAAGTVSALEKLLSALDRPWDASASPLYRHMETREYPETLAGIREGLLRQFRTDPECAFLREEPGFQALLKQYSE